MHSITSRQDPCWLPQGRRRCSQSFAKRVAGFDADLAQELYPLSLSLDADAMVWHRMVLCPHADRDLVTYSKRLGAVKKGCQC